ncbi:MAG: hypothetical protein IJQ37_06610 [Clostridia bacterium]|nr:hypothetical protein [Clostridia bacterium]
MTYKNKIHEKIFKSHINEFSKSNGTLAAIYILTADNTLWKIMKYNCDSGNIDFDKVQLAQLPTEQYAVLMAAKDICLDQSHLTMTDLADKNIFSQRMFSVIMNAMYIARFGKSVL